MSASATPSGTSVAFKELAEVLEEALRRVWGEPAIRPKGVQSRVET
ncbi:hypothetical protein [Streptosporangium sp. KLBMP 9127]